MKKLAVIFPGVGYHTDKPLLYYAKKLAREKEYEIFELSYTKLPQNIKGDAQKMKEAFDIACAQVEEQLAQIDFSAYEKIWFASKSIGTVIASTYDGRHAIGAVHTYFTPVPQTFDAARDGSGVVFHGLSDPWCDNATAENGCQKRKLPLYTYEAANHSLETGKTAGDIQIIHDVFEILGENIT